MFRGRRDDMAKKKGNYYSMLDIVKDLNIFNDSKKDELLKQVIKLDHSIVTFTLNIY